MHSNLHLSADRKEGSSDEAIVVFDEAQVKFLSREP